jgi:hypothetical protein
VVRVAAARHGGCRQLRWLRWEGGEGRADAACAHLSTTQQLPAASAARVASTHFLRLPRLPPLMVS